MASLSKEGQAQAAAIRDTIETLRKQVAEGAQKYGLECGFGNEIIAAAGTTITHRLPTVSIGYVAPEDRPKAKMLNANATPVE